MTNPKTLGIALVAIVIAIGGYFFPQVQTKVEQVFRGASTTFVDGLELLGGVTFGRSAATSTTATTQTLSAADIVGPEGVAYDVMLFTPNTGDTTLTFPATSSLPHFIPKAGMMARQCWHNASTTAGIDIIFAAGTGMDLETASSTRTDLTLIDDQAGCFTFIRKTNKDMLVLFQEFTNGD